MDKKNTIIGIILIGVAFWMMTTNATKQRQIEDAVAAEKGTEAAQVQKAEAQSVPAAEASITSALAPEENLKPQSVVLENDFIRVFLTNKGGAIASVELLKHEKMQGSKTPYVFNETDRAAAMTLAFPSDRYALPVPFEHLFAVTKKSDESVSFEFFAEGKIKITRTYSISKGENGSAQPYSISCKTLVENLSAKPMELDRLFLSLGMAAPTAGDVYGTNLAFCLYDGSSAHFVKVGTFLDSSGFLGIGASKAKPNALLESSPAVWGAVKNQFFTSVFTPEKTLGKDGVAFPLVVNRDAQDKFMKSGVLGYMAFSIEPVLPKASVDLSGSFFVGPKEFNRLADLGKGQEALMDFGWAGFISRPLLRLLNWIHSYISGVSPVWAWGWSIVILTIIVRLILLPLTAVQIRSSKRMQALQKPIAELRAKYGDDKQKIGTETMKLYGEYGINPFAGCLPLFFQLPIFIGLYYMLQVSSELRFAHFLWIDDLSLPDTIDAVPTIFGFPLHVLPLVNAALTFFQMHLTPMPSADKAQKMIFKFMPVIMLVFFYTFPSGLVLYWSVQSVIGIAQTFYIMKTKDKVVLKKRDPKKGGGFFQKIQMMQEESRLLQEKGYSQEQIREHFKKKAHDMRQQKKVERSGVEKRKANPGGRNTKPKR